MIDWFWYYVGCLVSPPTIFFVLWIFDRIGIIDFELYIGLKHK